MSSTSGGPDCQLPTYMTQAFAKRDGLERSIAQDWRLYFYEGAELAIFMVSACVCTVILFHPGYSALRVSFQVPILRRSFMGLGMGLTAVLIIHSPMGKRSGAHFNPAITLTYLRLGKRSLSWDAVFYVLFQFAGGLFGVGFSCPFALGRRLVGPGVELRHY